MKKKQISTISNRSHNKNQSFPIFRSSNSSLDVLQSYQGPKPQQEKFHIQANRSATEFPHIDGKVAQSTSASANSPEQHNSPA